MANTFLTVDLIAREALATLYENAVMAGLVWRDFDPEFDRNVNGYKQGDTVTIRKPATFTAEDFVRANGITVQDGTETSTSVTLDTIADVSFTVTAEELALEIGEFGERLLTPAMEAIWQHIDAKLLALRSDVTAEVGEAGTSSTHDYDTPEVLIDARKTLNTAKVPQSQRYAVIGPDIEAPWIADPLFHQADQRGDTEGLREASIGRKFGFDNFMDQNVDDLADASTTEVGVGFHRTAFCLAARPLPANLPGATAAVQNYKGLTLRVAQDYDITTKESVMSVDLLFGVKTLDANRAVLIKGADTP